MFVLVFGRHVGAHTDGHQHGLPQPRRGLLKKFLYGEAMPPCPTPYLFIYHFFRKGTPFVYLLKMTYEEIVKTGSLLLIVGSTPPPGHGVSIQISINLEKTFLRISRIRKIAVTRILESLHIYLLSFPRFWNLSIDRL